MTQNNTVFDNALRDFKRSAEITRDVRFQANLRLNKRQRDSSYMVSLLSLYVIALSLIPNIVSLSNQQSQLLLACSIIMSVFVIFTSLIDGAQNFYHQGELLHRCARKVANIFHELKNIDPTANNAIERFRELQEEYRVALDECPINHENIDFLRETAYKPHLFPDNYSKNEKIRFVQIHWNWMYARIASRSWMTFHVVAIIAVSFVIYQSIWLK